MPKMVKSGYTTGFFGIVTDTTLGVVIIGGNKKIDIIIYDHLIVDRKWAKKLLLTNKN